MYSMLARLCKTTLFVVSVFFLFIFGVLFLSPIVPHAASGFMFLWELTHFSSPWIRHSVEWLNLVVLLVFVAAYLFIVAAFTFAVMKHMVIPFYREIEARIRWPGKAVPVRQNILSGIPAE